MQTNQKIKMYILVRDSIDTSHAMLAVGHGVLACHLKYETDIDYQDWLKNSYRKCVCKLTDAEFEQAKKLEKHVIMTESGLGGIETALVFCPRQPDKLEKPFNFYKLWK